MLKKIHFIKKSLPALCLYGSCFTGNAQAENTGLWVEAKYFYETSKNWELSIAPQLRFHENFHPISEYLTSLNVSKKMAAWKPQLELRYARENDVSEGIFENFFRYRFNLSYEKEFAFLEWNLRLGYQNKKQLEANRKERKVSRIRSKFKFNTEVLGFTPALFTEYLYAHSNTKRNQLRLGVDWRRKMNAHRIGLRYMLIFYPNNNGRPAYHVLRLGYELKAKRNL